MQKNKITSISLLIVIFLFSALPLFAQKGPKVLKAGYLEFEGNTKKSGAPVVGTKVLMISAEGDTITSVSQSNGRFLLTIPLMKEYTFVFIRPGFYTRSMLVSSKVPDDEKFIVFSNEFNIEMIETTENLPAEVMDKPVAKMSYDASIQDFDFDKAYSKRVKDDITKARAAAKPKPAPDLQALANARADSIAKADAEAKAKAAADAKAKAAADELKKQAAEKAKADSLSKANADAKAKAAADLIKKQAADKSRADSIAKAGADAKAKAAADEIKRQAAENAKSDSIAKANADAKSKAAADAIKKQAADKAHADSLAKADSDAKSKAAAEVIKKQAADKARADSLAKADAASRAKIVADQTRMAKEAQAKASADSAARAEADLRAKADVAKLKKEQEASLKKKLDSLAQANIQRKKLEEEAEKKRLADIQAKKDAMNQNASSEGKKAPADLPKIDKVYPVGMTEEVITEKRRTINRTVINRDGVQYALHKVVYDWGGVFWFKNEASISESQYQLELKQAKDLVKKSPAK